MKPIVVYHQTKPGTDCPDGICAAWVAAKAFNFDVELVGEVYRKESDWVDHSLPFDPTNRTIVFVDWCGYPQRIYEAIAAKAEKAIILDHHKSARDTIWDLSDRLPNVQGIYSPNEVSCGATISWDYFFPSEERPWFLKFVRTRDTGMGGYWLGKLPEHEAINSALSKLRKGKVGVEAFSIFDELCEAEDQEYGQLLKMGQPEVERKNKLAWAEVERWRQNSQHINLVEKYGHLLKQMVTGEEVPYLEIKSRDADYAYSWVGTYLAEINPESPYVVIVTAGDRSTMHIRKPAHSKSDCGMIASRFGGGGHADAAGFSV